MAETPESSANKWGWDFSESPVDSVTTESSCSSTSTSHTESPESNNDDDDKSGGDVQQTQQQLTTATTTATGKPPKSMDRRRRHRENMIRYRRKKKATVGEMVHEEQVLAAQLHSMLDLHASQSQTYNFSSPQQHLADSNAISSEDDVSLQELNDSHGPPTVMDAFVNVLTEKERLHEENVALRQHLGEFHKFHHQVQDTVDEEALDEELRLAHQQDKHNSSNGDGGYWIKFLPDEVPFYYMPLTEQECGAYAAQTLTSVYAMQSTYLSGGYPGAHSVTLFDWTASLKLDVDKDTQLLVIRYEFTKTFRRSPRTVGQLVDSQWNIMHTPDLYQSIHRVPVKTKVLQKVNDHLSVVMWSAPEPEQSVRFRNVSVYSRTAYQNPQGHECQLIGMTGVPLKMPADGDLSPPARTVEGDPVVYVTSGFMYTSFAQLSKEQQKEKRENAKPGLEMEEEQSEISVAFGGYAMIFNEAQARFLMVELGGTCVRLEQLLFPFRVLRS